MGYTLAKVREDFRQAVEARIIETRAEEDYADVTNHEWTLHRAESLAILSVLTFDQWLDATGIIFRGNHYPGLPRTEGGLDAELPPVVQYLLDDSGGEVW